MIQVDRKDVKWDDYEEAEMDYEEFKKFNDFGIIGVNVYKPPVYKAKLQLGNLQFMSEKKFNWLKRFMLRTVFGIDVENLK